MPYDPFRQPRRRSIRLPGYDYTRAGAYFVTLCTHQRECLFGEVVDEGMVLSEWGEIAVEEWQQTAVLRPAVRLDEFAVMPNHIHAIVWIERDDADCGRGTARRAPTTTPRQFGKPIAGSLPTILGAYKSAVTKHVNRLRNSPGARVWQRGYYEHIVRGEGELDRIRAYTAANAARWDEDHLNPLRAAPAAADNEPYPWEEEGHPRPG